MDAQTANNLWIVASTAVGTIIGSGATFFFPKIWEVYKSRYIDPKAELFKTLQSQIEWFTDRAEKLAAFRRARGGEVPPDRYRLEVLISRLDPKDREWAIKEADIDVLRQIAEQKASECRQNADDVSRTVNLIGNKVFSVVKYELPKSDSGQVDPWETVTVPPSGTTFTPLSIPEAAAFLPLLLELSRLHSRLIKSNYFGSSGTKAHSRA